MPYKNYQDKINYNIEYYIKNKDRLNKYSKENRMNNKDYFKNHEAEYRKTDKRKQYLKEWRLNNKEKIKEHQSRYYYKKRNELANNHE